MKQFKISTATLTTASDDDCYLAPDDPIWEMMPASQMGGLGSENLLAKYRTAQMPAVKTDDRGRIAREQNIKPGTDEWFKHWFGNK